jgi:hypothetical protein
MVSTDCAAARDPKKSESVSFPVLKRTIDRRASMASPAPILSTTLDAKAGQAKYSSLS